jgi:hypothetical protein
MRKLYSNKHNNAFKKKELYPRNYLIWLGIEYIQVNTYSDGRNDTDYKD